MTKASLVRTMVAFVMACQRAAMSGKCAIPVL